MGILFDVYVMPLRHYNTNQYYGTTIRNTRSVLSVLLHGDAKHNHHKQCRAHSTVSISISFFVSFFLYGNKLSPTDITSVGDNVLYFISYISLV